MQTENTQLSLVAHQANGTPIQDESFSTLIDKIPAMMHSINADGYIVAVSQKWLETLGYTRDEVIGRKSSEFLTEASCQYANEQVLPAFFITGKCTDIPYQFVKKSGQVIDVLLSANCERDGNGEVFRSISVMQNVTDLRQTQELLSDSKDYAENLLRTANVMAI